MLAALAFTAIYLGGGGADDCDDIAFDRAGYAYLACHSSSEGFTGAEKKDMDAFVVKFDTKASRIVYATRIGGSGWDAAFRVVVDARGGVWVAGGTRSVDFPYRQECGAECDAFVARLDGDGAVERVTMLRDGTVAGLVIKDSKAYLAGTKSPNAEDASAYVAEMAPNGEMRMLTLGPGIASGLAFDGRDGLYAVGFHGKGAFVARVDLAGWRQTAIRTIGSVDADRARAVVADGSGRVLVLGTAASASAAGREVQGKSDVFLAEFDANLKQKRITLFGGTSEDVAGFNGASLAVDGEGKAWAVGMTRSADLPAQGRFSGADDGFVARIGRDGGVRWSSYFGGAGFEMLEGVAVAPDGAVWASGLTTSHGSGRSEAVLVKWTVSEQ